MRKNKEIKFIQVDDKLININNITRICKGTDERTYINTVDDGCYYDEPFESVKKKLESVTLKE